MKLRLPNLSRAEPASASLRAIWIVAPIVVGVGVALYLRRKKLADGFRHRAPSIAPSGVTDFAATAPLDEWVSEPQIQPDAKPDFLPASASLPVGASEASEAKESRADEFVIPMLIPLSPGFDPDHSTRAAVRPGAPRRSGSARRSARRIAAAALTFLVTAAIVYGTVGAVRSHQKSTGPLLFAESTAPTPSEAPAEGPNFEATQAGHSSMPPGNQALPASSPENLGAAPSQSPGSAIAQSPPPTEPRKIHRRHSASRHSRTAKGKTKTPVPWKVSF
jgi:hypothetical protein